MDQCSLARSCGAWLDQVIQNLKTLKDEWLANPVGREAHDAQKIEFGLGANGHVSKGVVEGKSAVREQISSAGEDVKNIAKA